MNKNKLMAKIIENGYTQKTLAKELGISKNTFCNSVNNRRPFNTDEIQELCEKLGISSGKEKVDIFLTIPSQNRDE